MKKIAIILGAVLLASCGSTESQEPVANQKDNIPADKRSLGRSPTEPSGTPTDVRSFVVAPSANGQAIPVVFDIRQNRNRWQAWYLDLKDRSYEYRFASGACGEKIEDELIRIVSIVSCEKDVPFDVFRVTSTLEKVRVHAEQRLPVVQPGEFRR